MISFIREYKKFIYPGAVSDFVVTPSKIIDQVWHEHLLFTKAYRDFCTDVLGFSFDHKPQNEGSEADTKAALRK